MISMCYLLYLIFIFLFRTDNSYVQVRHFYLIVSLCISEGFTLIVKFNRGSDTSMCRSFETSRRTVYKRPINSAEGEGQCLKFP